MMDCRDQAVSKPMFEGSGKSGKGKRGSWSYTIDLVPSLVTPGRIVRVTGMLHRCAEHIRDLSSSESLVKSSAYAHSKRTSFPRSAVVFATLLLSRLAAHGLQSQCGVPLHVGLREQRCTLCSVSYFV